jgi:hypothetical protein
MQWRVVMRGVSDVLNRSTRWLALLSVILGSFAPSGHCAGRMRLVDACESRVRKCCCRDVSPKPACCCYQKSEQPPPVPSGPIKSNGDVRSTDWVAGGNSSQPVTAITAASAHVVREQQLQLAMARPSFQRLFCIWQI